MAQDSDQQSLAPLPENPTPQDYGLPANPSSADLQRWARQERYLEALSRSGSTGAAAAEAGIPVGTAQSWDFNDTHSFKRRRAVALESFMGRVEAEINRRAIEGIDKPVIYQGRITGTYKEYSDNLLMFRAKKLDPSYKDNYQPGTVNDNRKVTIVYNYPPGLEPFDPAQDKPPAPRDPEPGTREPEAP